MTVESRFLVLVGLVSIVCQVVVLRELAVAFYGVELVYVLALGGWLLASGLGALAMRYVRPAVAVSSGTVALLLIALALLAGGELLFLRGLRRAFSVTPGAYLPPAQVLAGLALAVVPPGLVTGAAFAAAVQLAMRSGATFGRAYGLECAGGLLGGVVATLAGATGVGAVGLAAGSLLVAVVGVSSALRPTALRRTLALALLAGVALVVFARAPSLDASLTRWNHPTLVATRDTPYGRSTLARNGDQIVAFENDALVFDSEDVAAEAFAHPALLQHAQPERIVLLGGAGQGMLREILRHSPRSVVAVEKDAHSFYLLQSLLPLRERAALTSPVVELRFADPRTALRDVGRPDVIFVGGSHGDSAESNRLYTREFMTLAAERLGEHGLLALRLRASENLRSPLELRRTASIVAAARGAFAEVLLLPGSVDLVLASQRPLSRDPELLAERLHERRIETRLVSAAYLAYLLTNDRVDETAARLTALAHVEQNSDARPICYSQTAALWLSLFIPRLAFVGPGWRLVPVAAMVVFGLAFLPVVAGLVRTTPARHAATFAYVAGFTGMVLETVLLLHYQAKEGALFQDVGLLLAAFMAGMATGSLALARIAVSRSRLGAGRLSLLLVSLTMVSSVSVGLATRSTFLTPLPCLAALMALAGVVAGALLAFSAIPAETDGDLRRSAPLLSADLAGGAVAAVLASLLLVPFLGLEATALLTALGSALLLWKPGAAGSEGMGGSG